MNKLFDSPHGSRGMQTRMVRRTCAAIEHATERPVLSWRNHAYRFDRHTSHALAEAGVRVWSDEVDPNRVGPYRARERSRDPSDQHDARSRAPLSRRTDGRDDPPCQKAAVLLRRCLAGARRARDGDDRRAWRCRHDPGTSPLYEGRGRLEDVRTSVLGAVGVSQRMGNGNGGVCARTHGNPSCERHTMTEAASRHRPPSSRRCRTRAADHLGERVTLGCPSVSRTSIRTTARCSARIGKGLVREGPRQLEIRRPSRREPHRGLVRPLRKFAVSKPRSTRSDSWLVFNADSPCSAITLAASRGETW